MIDHWQEIGYSDITEARIEWPMLVVHFENGDEVQVGVQQVGISRADSVGFPRDEPLGVTVSDADGDERRISWEVIRSLSDPRFATYRKELEQQEARRFGARLKALREDAGLSQKALADLAGMKPPQLAKIERGDGDLRLSTATSLLVPLNASLADVVGPDIPEVSSKVLIKRVKEIGVHPDVASRIRDAVDRNQFGDALARAFKLDKPRLLSGEALAPASFDLQIQFKTIATGDPVADPMLSAARQISAVVLRNTPQSDQPVRPRTLLGQIDVSNAEVALTHLVNWSWNAGMPVIPLAGRGGFTAAVWKVSGRPVILLKDSRTMAAFWLFDLAHELGHLAAGHLGQDGLVDVGKPVLGSEDDQEQAANEFALELLVPNTKALLHEIHDRSVRDGSNLFKGAVESVASRERIDPALLGLIAAFELTDVGRTQDRWGSANNLGKETSGPRIVKEALQKRLDLRDADELDAAWIRALTTGG